MKKFCLTLILMLLFACKTNNNNILQNYPEDPYLKRKQYAGNLFGNEEGIVIFKDKNKKTENYKNKDSLWQKSIEVISNILPITIADKNTGLIITDWGEISNISNNNILYKINIIIKGQKIEENNLQVSAFKKENNGYVSIDIKIQNMIKKLILD